MRREISVFHIRGKITSETWEGLAKSINDKIHIVHEVLDYRLNLTKIPSGRKRLLKELEKISR